VPTLVHDPPPVEFEQLLERRRMLGQDRHDEVWEGTLHMNPGPHERHSDLAAQVLVFVAPLAKARGLRPRAEFNLGQPDDYRVPGGGLRRPGPPGLFCETAALVLEITSPGDETWDKLGFYATHGVDELLIVDPLKRTVDWLRLAGDQYEPTTRSGLIDLGADELVRRLEWPEG
jgi:Uma2 family endonuclease